jgi:hypothetical protein
MSTEKSWLENMMDNAEAVVGGMERAAKNAEGVWGVEEITDAESGETVWNVSDCHKQKIHVLVSKELAEVIASLLNK